MDTIRQDIAFALRMLRKSPIFAIVAVGAIALGSAAVTTIYSVVNAVLLESAPGIGHAGQLVSVQKSNVFLNGFSNMSYPLYRDLRDRAKTISGLAAYTPARMDVGLSAVDAREPMAGMIVTGNFFDVLEVKPAAGRFFLPDEDRTPLAAPVAVISYRMWADRFNKSPDVIGRTIVIQTAPFTIVGVAPEGFNGTTAFVQQDLYVPTMMTSVIHPDESHLLDSWPSGWLAVVARLRPDVSRPVVEHELGALAIASRDEAGQKGDLRVQVRQLRPVPANGVTVVSIFMSVLMAVAGLVLLIASSNVASMLLARGVARRKEFVVRLAIGANRARLIRQLLTESVLLFLIGGATGVILTGWLIRFTSHVHVDIDVPIAVNLPLNARVLSFTLLMSFVTGIIFGLVPALSASRRDLSTALRAEGAGAGARRERTRSVFVVVQLAMSVLLLVCAGLFVRAFAKGRLVKPGYAIDNVVVAPLSLANAGYDSTRARQFYKEVTDRIAARPGVEGVAASNMVPLGTSNRVTAIDIPGVEPPRKLPHTMVPYETVTNGFFQTIELPLLAGRVFGESDSPSTERVAVVTERFARQYFGGRDRALGKTFTLAKRSVSIVGVVGDGRFVSLADEAEPFLFLPEAQQEDKDLNLLIRVRDHAAATALVSALAGEVRAIDATVTRPRAQLLTEAASVGLLPQRIAAGVTAVLGFVGLVLASLGLYGVIAHGVSQRTREIGIRMALGADSRAMVGMVMGEGLRLVGIGTAIGMVIAVAGSRVLAGFLFGVSPTDPTTLLAVPATLGIVALAASWFPARRAARIGVAGALRGE